jgi:hypothetical protein
LIHRPVCTLWTGVVITALVVVVTTVAVAVDVAAGLTPCHPRAA